MTLHPGRTGWVVSIIITDLKGHRIKILANNHLIGTSSAYLWNGEDGNGYQCAEGFYLITVLGYHDASGSRKRVTRSVALIYR